MRQTIILSVVALIVVLATLIAFRARQSGSERLAPHTLWDVNEVVALMDTSDWHVCENHKAGYRFLFPNNWQIYGEGSTNQGRALIGPTPCEGFAVTVTDQPPRMDSATADATGLYIRVDDADYLLTLNYIKNWPGISGSHVPIDGATFLEAWAATSSPKWLTVNGASFIMTGPRDKTPTIAAFHNQRLFAIDPDSNLDPKVFQTILSTFEFING